MRGGDKGSRDRELCEEKWRKLKRGEDGSKRQEVGGKDEAKRLTGCEVGSVWKVTGVVNRMHLAQDSTHTHTKGRKYKALTSDSPGRPRPESDKFCRLKQKRNDTTEKRRRERGESMNHRAVKME